LIETLAPLLGLALLDSVNPSALAVTIYLILEGRGSARRVLVYMSAVFFTYLAVGVLLMLGLGSVWGFVDGPAAYAVQGAAGALLLGYALLAPAKPRKGGVRLPQSFGLVPVFLLGVTVTAVEFSTAFPYLGAIALLTNASLPPAQWLLVLVGYNAIFVLPPLLLLAAYSLFGARLRGRMQRWRERLERGTRETLLWILGIVGFLLLADALAYFEFFGLL
jgi:cytochrome c biogenesis protein CcdA